MEQTINRTTHVAGGDSSSPRSAKETADSPLERLKGRLKRDKLVRLTLEFMERFSDAHLKLLNIEEVTDDRRMKVAGRSARPVWNFGCDSFLGLDRDARVQQAIREALPRWGTHNGSSRAFTSVTLCDEVERRLARWLGVSDTLLYPTVTLANIGLLPTLSGKGQLLIVDRLSHDSVQQGAKLAQSAGADLRELTLNRPDVLERLLQDDRQAGNSRSPACLLAIDGVYSMTGYSPPLAELDCVARAYGGVMYVDDAHGTGVAGPCGRGAACAALGTIDKVVVVGSLSKAFSCLGAFVTCDPEMKVMLKTRSNTFIFGGPVPPPYLAGLLVACDIVSSSEGDELRARLHSRIDRLTEGIRSLGLTMTGGGESPIVSVVIGEIEQALEAGKWLFDRGIYVQSAHYPAVSITGSLLRIQVNANHPVEAIDDILNALADLQVAFKLPKG
jgi:7-keto-8-aminopelargonate synthetase-like enzyme